MASYQKVNEKTPNGGDYSEIYYLDKHGNRVDEEKAETCVIRECLADGTLVKEIHGVL